MPTLLANGTLANSTYYKHASFYRRYLFEVHYSYDKFYTRIVVEIFRRR